MNLLKLSLAGLRDSWLTHALNIVLLGLGLGTVTLLILMTGGLRDRLTRDAKGIDLVVGAKGSPLQLVLSTVFQADIPTGNIPLEEAATLSANPFVSKAIPLALGDSVRSFRIVGTTADYPALYNGRLEAGRLWVKPMEAVLGSYAERRLSLKLGDHFTGSHGVTEGGHEHADHPYVVTGILEPTGSVLDRLVLTSVESVWDVHASHHHVAVEPEKEVGVGREVTAVLLRVKSPLAVITLPHQINSQTPFQAAVPSLEYARLLSATGFGLDILQALAIVLIASSALETLIALYTRLKAHEQDLAVLRLLGASRSQLFTTILIEALLLSSLGAIVGLMLGHIAGFCVAHWLPPGHALSSMSLGWRGDEAVVPVVALATGFAAALVPAVTAYRSDVSRALSGSLGS